MSAGYCVKGRENGILYRVIINLPVVNPGKFNKAALTLCAAALMLLSGCVVFRHPQSLSESAFKQVLPTRLPDFADTKDRAGLIRAAENSLAYLQSLNKETLYTIGDRQVAPALLAASLKEFIKIAKEAKTEADLKAKIAEKFDIYRSVGSDGKGLVTFSSYYEPIFKASKVRTAEYKYPLYRRPNDLVDVNLEDFNSKKYKGEQISGKLDGSKLVPYISRTKIDIDRVLEGKGLEIAWLRSRLEVMNLHVEGSARLEFPDGTVMRADFAGTNSLPFRGHISALKNANMLPEEGDKEAYIKDHPELDAALPYTNPRYVFFELKEMDGSGNGPTGTYGGPLVGGRSIAVDTKYVPLGGLAFFEASLPRFDADGNLLEIGRTGKFVLPQDTGGAIKGPGRVDYFAGSGEEAKRIATRTWENGSLYLLILKAD